MGSSLLSLLAIDKFDDPDYSDCEVHVEDKVFRVNTLCLKLHSDVFFACFHHDTVEKTSGVVKIEDASVSLVELMLRFMYSGKVENLDEEAYSLFILADRYNVVELMKLCAQSMCNSLQVGTIFNCLNVAYRLNAEELKQKCLQYVADNADKIIDQPEWTLLTDQEPSISRDFSRLLNERLLERNNKVTELESRLERCRNVAASTFRLPRDDQHLRDVAGRMRGEVDRLNDRLRLMQREMANVLVLDPRNPNRQNADVPAAVPQRLPLINMNEARWQFADLNEGRRGERFHGNPLHDPEHRRQAERRLRQAAADEQNLEVDRLLARANGRQEQIESLDREIARLNRLRTEARNDMEALDPARRFEAEGRIFLDQISRFNMQIGVTRRRLNEINAGNAGQANAGQADQANAGNADAGQAGQADQANAGNADQANAGNADQERNRRRRNFPFVNDEDQPVQAQRRRRHLDAMELDRLLNEAHEAARRRNFEVEERDQPAPANLFQAPAPRLIEIDAVLNEAQEVLENADARQQAILAAIAQQVRDNGENEPEQRREERMEEEAGQNQEAQIENDPGQQEENNDSDVEIIDAEDQPGPANQNRRL